MEDRYATLKIIRKRYDRPVFTHEDGINRHVALGEYHADIHWLIEEVDRLRQGLWDCAGDSGADLDGDRTPAALVAPDLVDFARRAVQELREDYDDALLEVSHIEH